MCCHANFIYKDKMNKRSKKVLSDAVPTGKDLLKIGVRDANVANMDDTLVCLAPTLTK